MKKTITINLGGRAFLITEEAYNSLDDYLSSIASTFKGHDSADDITADIEARISELCERRLAQSHGEIIEQELVNEMINRMGKPEAMIDEDSEELEDGHTTQEKSEEKEEANKKAESIFDKLQLNKKYYLDTEDRMAGGVISGLAAYLKTDVTILRIIALVAIIATGFVGIIAYFVVWCIAPTAGNTSEKLRMQGIEPTPEKIAEKITNDKETTPSAAASKEKNNITRFVVIAIISIVASLLLSAAYFTPRTGLFFNGCTQGSEIMRNGTIILLCIFLAGFFVQKTSIPRTIKTILLVAIVAFALLAIFVMMMTALH